MSHVSVLEYRMSATHNGHIFYKVLDVVPFEESVLNSDHRSTGVVCWYHPETKEIYESVGRPLYKNMKVLYKEVCLSNMKKWSNRSVVMNNIYNETKRVLREKRLRNFLDGSSDN